MSLSDAFDIGGAQGRASAKADVTGRVGADIANDFNAHTGLFDLLRSPIYAVARA
jgi:hypothetical protein